MPEAPGAPRHFSAYSWRARLGVIVPPTNTVNEAEWARLMPEGTSFHTMRMPLHADTTSEAGQRALHDDLDKAMAELVKADVDVIAYACTAGSMTHPPQSLPERMQAGAGAPDSARLRRSSPRSMRSQQRGSPWQRLIT